MVTTNQPRGLGWLPDVPSIKDYTATTPEVSTLLEETAVSSRARAVSTKGGGRASAAAAAPALSPTVDLRAFCSPIEDQEALGSCTANAAAGLVEYFERKAFGKYVDASRLFIYKATRNLLELTGDTGAYLRSTMGALVLFGAPPEQYWPYDIASFDVEPTAFCYAFAANFQAIKYFRLDPSPLTGTQVLQNIKSYLAAGFPSMFGFPVYDEYMHIPANGEVAFPAPKSRLYGGHANVAVGYDDNLTINGDQGALLVRNSWGTSWGLGGYAWLSYRYVTEELAVDWWSVIKQEWVDTGKF
jgi:C1A family cysteine protease